MTTYTPNGLPIIEPAVDNVDDLPMDINAVAQGAESAIGGVETRAKEYADSGDTATLTSAKSYADDGDSSTLTSAESYADTGDTATLNSAKGYADTGDSTTLTSAKNHADTGDSTTLTSAKTYTDDAIVPLATKTQAQGYVDAGFAGTSLPWTTDFNTVTTPGNYRMTSDTNWQARNMPTNTLGGLFVKQVGDTLGLLQTYETWNPNPAIYHRIRNSGGIWREWHKMPTHTIALPGTTNLNDVTEAGDYYIVVYGTGWAEQNAPVNEFGSLEVRKVGNGLVQVFTAWAPTARTYTRIRETDGTWHPWQAPETNSAPSGFKTAAFPVTVDAGGTYALASQSVRLPIDNDARYSRRRIRISNQSPMDGAVEQGSIPFTGLWLGRHVGGGVFDGNQRQVVGPFSTPADGSEWVSPWITGDGDLLSYGYTAPAGVNVIENVGQCWVKADPNTAGDTDPAPFPHDRSTPFRIWIETETDATTPNLAVLGDSITAGIGGVARTGSWLSKYCAGKGILPTHHTYGGDLASSWADTTHTKWDLYDAVTDPDSLIVSIGSNDINAGASLDQLKAWVRIIIDRASQWTENIHVGTIIPRNDFTTAQNDVRVAFNQWVKSEPENIRGVVDFSAAVAAPDGVTLDPAYDSGDGVHPNDAGYAAMAAAIALPVTSEPKASTLELNDYAKKTELVQRTGLRLIYAPDGSDGQFASGSVFLSRSGSRVALILENLKPAAGTGPSVVQLPLPPGFRPATSLVASLMGANGSSAYLQQYQILLDTPDTMELFCNGPVGNRSETFNRLSVICRGEMAWETFNDFPTVYPGTAA